MKTLYRSGGGSVGGGGLLNKSKFLFSADYKKAVRVPTQPAYDAASGSANYILNLTTAKVYAWFDGLMAQYPEYITKENLGKDQSGQFDIYGYSFKTSAPRTQASVIKFDQRRIKVMLETVHNEQMNFAYLFQFLKTVFEADYTSPELAALKYNVEYYVIPVGNPWGLDNVSRPNSRGVDLNRNFPTGWTFIDSPTHGSGSAPLSEAEAMIIYNKFNQFKPDIYISCHSNGMQKEDGTVLTSTSLRSESKVLYESHFRGICAYGEDEAVAAWLPDPHTLSRTIIYDEPFGVGQHYASSTGAIGVTPEFCYWIRESPSGESRGSSEAMTLAVSVMTNTVMTCIEKLIEG